VAARRDLIKDAVVGIVERTNVGVSEGRGEPGCTERDAEAGRKEPRPPRSRDAGVPGDMRFPCFFHPSIPPSRPAT
jgi:hypothetical protein